MASNMKDMVVYGLLGMILGWTISQGISPSKSLSDGSKYGSEVCDKLLIALDPSGMLRERDVCFVRAFLDADDLEEEAAIVKKHESLLDIERISLLIDLARKCRVIISPSVDSVKFRCTESFPVGSILSIRSDCTTPRVFGGSEASNTLGKSLHKALSEPGLHRMVKSIVEQGADVNSRDGYNDTPLSSAAAKGLKDLVEYLIGQGAQLDC
eukprot:TRINITY_DN5236_c0_g1_i1.p1 TRINITY_DN5236_c0_g1~~TRINITY_DN5236_c0_g1_i1.p1  ORF type:complete len:211 (+),score=23.08 TRINITY_DN5236_c0_g1_i1:126-758(+)